MVEIETAVYFVLRIETTVESEYILAFNWNYNSVMCIIYIVIVVVMIIISIINMFYLWTQF